MIYVADEPRLQNAMSDVDKENIVNFRDGGCINVEHIYQCMQRLVRQLSLGHQAIEIFLKRYPFDRGFHIRMLTWSYKSPQMQ